MRVIITDGRTHIQKTSPITSTANTGSKKSWLLKAWSTAMAQPVETATDHRHNTQIPWTDNGTYIQTHTQTNKQTHWRYQTHYLPCFAVDKHLYEPYFYLLEYELDGDEYHFWVGLFLTSNAQHQYRQNLDHQTKQSVSVRRHILKALSK